MKTGYTDENFNLTSNTGAYKLSVDGKEQWVQGEWFYAQDKQSGKDVLVGGAFKNGMDGNVLMYKQGSDGALHFSQVQGKFDSKGHLVAGSSSEITRTEFVEAIKDSNGDVSAEGVVVRQGTPGLPSVAVNAQAGKHVDTSNTYTMGTSVQSNQTLAGSAAQSEFEQGNQLGVGGASTAIAIGERSIEVTADKISQVTTVGGPLRDPTGRRAQERVSVQRSQENARHTAERHAEQVKRDGAAKTSRTLQHQSKSSNLPKSGGPPPMRNGKR